MSKRADGRPICNPRTNDEAEVVDGDLVADLRVHDADVGLDFAGGADPRLSLEDDTPG